MTVSENDAPLRFDEAIERRGLRDRVYDRILQLLMSGEVPPGARLSIEKIARQLAVSPTPVREAMVQLERTGLITREALKGYRMAPPLNPEQLAELFDARMMLETTAARLATPADPGFLRDLKAALDVHAKSGEAVIAEFDTGAPNMGVATEYFQRDADFHRVIFRHTGNHYLYEMSEGLGGLLHRMRQSVLHGVLDVSEALCEHSAILQAFESGDPSAPEQAMREHINGVRLRSLTMSD